jgi:hypothetical protein
MYIFEVPEKQNCIQKTWLVFQNAVYCLSRGREGNSQHMILSGIKFTSVVFPCICGEKNENEDRVAGRLRCIYKVAVRASPALPNILNNRSFLFLNIAL